MGHGQIDVLQLVTTRRPFFEQQVSVLERMGVNSTVVTVPQGTGDTRSYREYLRFHGRTLSRVVADDFDLVHANYGLTAPTALCQPTRPVVLSLWGSDVLGTYGWLSDLCSRFCDAVVVMSDEMADEVGTEAHVIPHGVDLERFAPRSTARARAELGWDSNAKHVLFPYDPSRRVKNYPRAEAIVDAVDGQSAAPVTLQVMAGVPHEQVPTYMNAADALLLTSVSEGSPNTVKEALACNLPVVSVDVGDVSDLVADVDNCAVSDSDDQLVRALLDVLASGAKADGRSQARTLSLERTGRELRTVYDDVLS